MTYYKTCKQEGNHGWSYTDPLHNEHGCYWFESPHGEGGDEWHQGEWVVPVAEGAIIEINDEAALALAQGLHDLLADKADDNWRDLDATDVHWRVVEARELLDGCSIAAFRRAATGEKP
jgi:hypothetical protein